MFKVFGVRKQMPMYFLKVFFYIVILVRRLHSELNLKEELLSCLGCFVFKEFQRKKLFLVGYGSNFSMAVIVTQIIEIGLLSVYALISWLL